MEPFRAERIRAIMESRGLDGLIASGPENFRYVTGFWSVSGSMMRSVTTLALMDGDARLRALVLPVSDLPSFADAGFAPELFYPYGRFFFEHHTEDETATSRAVSPDTDRGGSSGTDAGAGPGSSLKSRLKHAYASPADALSQALRDSGLAGGAIGLDETQVSPEFPGELRQRLPELRLSSDGGAFRDLRLIKSAAEVELLEKATEIAEDALFAALGGVTAGTSEAELAQQYALEVVRRGGRPFFTVVTFGERAALADTSPTERRLRPGDMLRFDLGAEYHGYRSDIARTAVLGEPSAKLRNYYDAMFQGEEEAIASAKPGVIAEDLFELTVNTVRESGVPHYKRHHVGHSIGLDVYDGLVVGPGVREPLAEGMVLCLETPYYELGWGGVQVEDLVHVTRDGARLLNKSSRDLIILPV